MKAVVIKAVGVIEVQDVPEPQCEADEIEEKDSLRRDMRQRPQKSSKGTNRSAASPRGATVGL